MSYREENDQVILTMSREDYERLLMLLGASSVHAAHGGKSLFTLDQILGLLNRLNQGNPHYTPYQVDACTCGERPHRISCPLGFANYFPHATEKP